MAYSSRKELHQQLEVQMSKALISELGIELKTSDSERLRQELNFARRAAREHGNNEYDMLIFRTCPTDPEHYVWIVKKVSFEDRTNPEPEEE